MPDYYHVLQTPRDADAATIRKAYRKQALKWHPDKNPDDRKGAEEKFKEIAEAYSVMAQDPGNPREAIPHSPLVRKGVVPHSPRPGSGESCIVRP